MSDAAEQAKAVSRVRAMMDDHETLLGVLHASSTSEGDYWLALREWPHPNEDGMRTISLRYAYLTSGDGSDGWIGGDSDTGAAGINIRVEGDDSAPALQSLAGMMASGAAKLDADDTSVPFMGDLLGEE